MNTPRINPLRTHPGYPYLSIRRSVLKEKPITLNDNQYRLLAKEITSKISKGKGIDEILFGNRFWNFSAVFDETQRPYETGVEWLGTRETYTETVKTVKTISLEGVYSLNGNDMKADIDCGRLAKLIPAIVV